ncbi:hypothetical protein AOL_s00004g109 [Orbilia oligospora ATCC 24927]|uniref:Uncharacterized protein n=2 Tax=Orbilia oligospora TaxID=2813651 RepID=G1WXU9_ARTOA|nr:hypothetical protein AOL_s00004g109 [Orbilia oligospora ATCC 24927]EGX54076.1 hypothetical protein AOL_s00004g109 [Orbilia oligospora ATCC 24927]KAF3286179.1 hypothetical protein TWF970_009728 [Orbilia oligospora]
MPPIPRLGSLKSFGSSSGSGSFTSSILNPLNPISPLSPINSFNLSSPLNPTSGSLNDNPPDSNTPSYLAPGNETNAEPSSYSSDTCGGFKKFNRMKATYVTYGLLVLFFTPLLCWCLYLLICSCRKLKKNKQQIADTALDGGIGDTEATNIIANSNEQSPADVGFGLSSTVGEEGGENFESKVKGMDIDEEITAPKEIYQPSIHRGGFEGHRVLYQLENSTENSEESLPAYTPRAE